MRTEKDKMLNGELYFASDPELAEERKRARKLIRLFNQSVETDEEIRTALLRELFGSVGKRINIEPSFRCDTDITFM
ncbi:putative maltose O-acetyltransferase Maa [Paenibacillus larvae subsp. larvae]|uniref:Putative maltose O-acetyltransferase Maa n=1 Tax=Paenibacillus larvae subsp. larvae TaxID=147375 RepID=A0A2L1U5W9_9BACL|nr:putative maltose O-acetyltransferase Maa [Paenibacillus larvae subsp. larvae]AVF32819.1 putative maltose O-acetyltransferase Maa [Paenibacillus larvae subsp. larvae]